MLNRTNHQSPFSNLLEHLSRQQNSVKELVETLLSRKKSSESAYQNCFQVAAAHDFEVFSTTQVKAVHKAESLTWPIVDSHFNPPSYLPIRAFRGDPSRVWGAVDKLRIFRSSGTNSGPEGRSWAGFTAEGLLFYKAASITGFLGVLERRVLPFSGDFLNMSLISLVPPVEKWPDSSLAQMVSWFSELWPTEYADEVSPKGFSRVLEKTAQPGRPLCIVGTAFHFVNFLDEWLAAGLPPFKLPAGSILVETGGTKGKSRSIERGELYHLMTQAFDVKELDIISEYGMCELASQAWDFVDETEASYSLDARRFRFPWWVKPAVMTHPSRCSRDGQGAILLQDFARVDLGHNKGIFPIQTEDLADLSRDGAFILKGRIPNAPLKGCSMRAEQSTAAATLPLNEQTTRSSEQGPSLNLPDETLLINAQKTRQWFESLCTDIDARHRLKAELQSEWLTTAAFADLSKGIPGTDDAFVSAAKNSCSKQTIPKRWLFIAPASHSVALIHPIAAAMTLGLDVRVRIPKIANIPGINTMLNRALELAKDHGFQVTTLGENWRLGPNDLRDGEHVLIFGDDETCNWVQSFATGRSRSFGHATSLTIARAEDFLDVSRCERILRDQLALRQRGCLSSRMIMVIGGDAKTIRKNLELALPEELQKNSLSPAERAARSQEIVRLEQLGFATNIRGVLDDFDVPGVILATKQAELKTLAESSFSGLSRLDLVIPILVLPETTDEIEIIQNLPKALAVRVVSSSSNSFAAFENSRKTGVLPKNLTFTRHGDLDAPAFDGRHMGLPFFAGSI